MMNITQLSLAMLDFQKVLDELPLERHVGELFLSIFMSLKDAMGSIETMIMNQTHSL